MTYRRLIFVLAILPFLAASCSQCSKEKETQDGEIHNDSTSSDTALQERELDLYKKRAIPTSADANFEDFLYAFLTDDEFAEARIADSITVQTGDSTTVIPGKEWNDMHLFKYQDLYSYLYTNETDAELIKSPDLNSVAFEWLNLDSLHADRYEFHLTDNKWQLERIVRHHSLDRFQNEFINFYCQFINDNEFQEQSLAKPVRIISMGDSEMEEGYTQELKEGEWAEFHAQTPMPEKTIVLMDYGQKITPGTNINLLVRSITQAAFANYHFRRTRGQWALYTVELM